MSVLIVTMPGDYHAHAVKWAIEQLGGRCSLLYPLDIVDGAEWAYNPTNQVLHTSFRGETAEYTTDGLSSVWMRRPGGIFPQEQLSDVNERAISEEEFAVLTGGIFSVLEHQKFCVNPHVAARAASLKPFQFSVAAQLGLQLPETLISNNAAEIENFFHHCNGSMIYKPLRAAIWPPMEKGLVTVPTTIIDNLAMLQEADLRSAPGIFQKKIDKVAEVRATFMGRSVFAWEKRFEGRTEQLDIDWRMMNRGAKHAKHVLPSDILDKSFELLGQLGLVFGCFDFAIDADGNYHFLEVNPQGQFLWGDYFGTWQNQLEAMAEFLLSGDRDFVYSERNLINNYQYADMGIFEPAVAEEEKRHYGNVTTFHCSRVSVPVKLQFAVPPTIGSISAVEAQKLNSVLTQ